MYFVDRVLIVLNATGTVDNCFRHMLHFYVLHIIKQILLTGQGKVIGSNRERSEIFPLTNFVLFDHYINNSTLYKTDFSLNVLIKSTCFSSDAL